MSDGGLFSDLPESEAKKGREEAGRARMREPVRDQIELQPVDLDSLIGPDDAVRIIWTYAERVDLRAIEEAIRAREHTPGQAPVRPHLLLALWLFATSQGVGSARALERLCRDHNAYRWLCGGVSVNYHGLSDFRAAHGALLDRLLTESVASLSTAGVINLDQVIQDGVRVRASAGKGSFRRRKTLRKELKKAARLVEQLKRESEDDRDASTRRVKAAQERAARERAERVAAALAHLDRIQAERAQRAKTHKKQVAEQREPRASTTDPEARNMKMPDGGFRPAYNCQFSTVADGQVVVGLEASLMGSDRGLLRPMTEQFHQRFARWPQRHLVDAGFHKNEDTEWAAAQGIKVYGTPAQKDPFEPRASDGPGVAAWRRRMASAHGKGVYKQRAMHECLNAHLRHWGLRQFTVRGQAKVRAVLCWFALANNILVGHRLRSAAA